MKQRLLARIDKLDALSRRDRMSLLLGFIALAAGIEFMFVQPADVKRQRIEESLHADTASQSMAQARAAAETAAQLAATQTRGRELQARLAALGVKGGTTRAGREPLAQFLSRSLRQQGVVLVSTRGLPVETVNTGAANDVAVAVAVPASAASAADAAALFRHRTELTLEGSVAGLTEAIDRIERELAPLRIERVRLAPRGSAGAVQATLVLTTINQERTWLAL
jgi:hypothetical protein